MDSLKDFELIEKAGFTPDIKMVASAAVSSLHYLKSLAVKLGIPIEQITAEHIIHEFAEQDAKVRKHNQEFAAFRAKKDTD